MARQITKEMAKRIAGKLGAEKVARTGKAPHDLMVVKYNGQVVAGFGIRRASEKDKGHDHIPKDLHVAPRFAKELARCPKTLKDWISEMVRQGVIKHL